MYKALEIANYFIGLGIKNQAPMSPLKLQGLLYCAQGWHLALNHSKPLFPEEFEAWQHSPLCREVYATFRHLKTTPIAIQGFMDFNKKTSEFLDFIYQTYGGDTAVELAQLNGNTAAYFNARLYGIEVIKKEAIAFDFIAINKRLENEEQEDKP